MLCHSIVVHYCILFNVLPCALMRYSASRLASTVLMYWGVMPKKVHWNSPHKVPDAKVVEKSTLAQCLDRNYTFK